MLNLLHLRIPGLVLRRGPPDNHLLGRQSGRCDPRAKASSGQNGIASGGSARGAIAKRQASNVDRNGDEARKIQHGVETLQSQCRIRMRNAAEEAGTDLQIQNRYHGDDGCREQVVDRAGRRL